MKRTIAALMVLETDHPLLDPGNIDVSSAKAAAELRRAVVDSLPDLTRVVAVLPLELAELMMQIHDRAARDAGLAPGYPPADYEPPGGR